MESSSKAIRADVGQTQGKSRAQLGLFGRAKVGQSMAILNRPFYRSQQYIMFQPV